jgi:hypothetical protein
LTEISEPVAAVRFAIVPAVRADVLHRALARAREAGSSAVIADQTSTDRDVPNADVIVSLPWPPATGHDAAALAAMAARKTVIVLETSSTAEWPALDPQTWQPRGFLADLPVVVSLDPRDEEHSLVLAIQRLSADAALRARLAQAAYEWSQRRAAAQPPSTSHG